MTRRLLFALPLLLLLTAPVTAQSPCSDCFYAAEEEVRKCLQNAISADDKNSCLENRRVRLKACSENQCQTVREETSTTETPSTPVRPGLAPYTPTEGEWLALMTRAALRREASPDRPYSLDIVLADPQTLQIIVRHASTMNREQVRTAIDAAKEAIKGTAKSYGWDKWVKIRETVETYAPKTKK
ncbi:MAG TPA: hypothetical protein DCQ94_20085 [Nitrospira sp.]|jgi:hypothetical protein|nr:hypothetical protein [Nitrospira sp.]